MSSLIFAAIDKKKITLFSVLIIAVYGLYSYYVLPKQEHPDVTAPIALVTTIYPGASPGEVEELVTEKIEDALSEVDGHDFIKSWSRNSISIVVLRLVQNRTIDVDEAWNDLRVELAQIENQLPEGCRKPEIFTDLTETAGMLVSLSGGNYSYDQLVSFAEDFKKKLSRVNGITRFEITGAQEKEVKVEVEAQKLNQHSFSLEDIIVILKAQNLEIPSGKIKDGEFRINVSTSGNFESIKDIENVIIDVSTQTGAPVRLKDVARISMGLEEGTYKIRQNGKNAVLLAGYFEPSKNIVLIGKDVRRVLDEVKNRFPPDLIVDEVTYQPHEVEDAVGSFMSSLLQGILLVIIVVFLGMGFRNAIIVSMAIPISILMTFCAMNIMGLKIHQLSTCALIIALGMLVDNAIVIADAIQVRLDDGMDRIKAAFEGARDSATPVFTSTLTTVAAFFPLLMLPGPAGEFLQSIPLIVMISLSASYLVAMFVTPAMASVFFRKTERDTSKRQITRRLFTGLLAIGLKSRKTTLLVAFGMFCVALYILSITSLRFFPNADMDIFYVNIRAERFDLNKAESLTIEVENFLKQQKEIVSYTSAIGNGLPKFYLTAKNTVQSENFGQILARFDLERSKRFNTKEDLTLKFQNQLDSTISGGTATVKLLEIGDPVDAPIVMRISGTDYARIEEVSKALSAEVENIQGTINVTNDITNQSYEFAVDVNSDVATNMGISKYDIQRQINIALYGARASVYKKAGNEYNIVVKTDISSKEQLENLAIKSTIAGNKVLLKQFAKIGLKPQIEDIRRYDREKSIAVVSDVIPGYNSTQIEDYIESSVLPKMNLDGVEISFDGEREKITKNFGNVGVSSIFAIIAVYLILLIQFNSFTQPLVILLTIPLSLVGSVIGMFVVGQPLSFTALLGVASLIGIVVNNAILLIEFINRAQREGQDIIDSCKDAVEKRFRPIMLTTVTTVMGLMPLLFSQSAMFTPMSIALVSGLIAATFLTMVIIPVVFAAIAIAKKRHFASNR